MDKIILARNLLNSMYFNMIDSKKSYTDNDYVLYNKIKKKMNDIIENFHIIDKYEYEIMKNELVNLLYKFKNINESLKESINNIIYILSLIHYPNYIENNILNINLNKKKISYYHKINTYNNINLYNSDDSDDSDDLDKITDINISYKVNNNVNNNINSYKLLNESDEEKKYLKKQKNIIKNKLIYDKKNNMNKNLEILDKNIENEKNIFIGKLEYFPNSKLCVYCDNYIDIKYFIKTSNNKTMDYCIHCWGWLNSNDINLQEGLYMGEFNQDIVFEHIKKTMPIHKTINCINNQCIFSIIEKLENTKKLNKIFWLKEDLEKLEKSNKYLENKISHRDVKFNWTKSTISI